MSEAVLDSSIIVAILKNEAIDEMAYSIVDGGIMSAVNVAEVYGKLRDMGLSSATSLQRIDRILATLDHIAPFTVRQARATGLLREPTRRAGLSLGDRACLALAIELKADVYTVDSPWRHVDIGIPIHVLR